MKVSDADVKTLASAIAEAVGRAGGGGGRGGGGGGGGGYSSGSDLASKIENSIINPIEGSFKLAGNAGSAMAATIRQSQNEFTELSKVGAGFRGDLVNLSVAAANSRLNLGEFSNLIKENRENFIGLGGSVTRGAERFAQLSKAFQDSPVSDNLKLLGYTSKDLNEVLAIQMSSMRYTQKMDEAGKKQAIESAAKLAEQMDEMSRLTGKSREEQAEAMKKSQQDAAINAKLALIGLKEGPAAEAKARAMFAEQYNEAQLRGQGQMFKEIFATGQIMSREAATQASLNSKQAEATRDSALAVAKRDEAAALAANERVRKAAFDDSKDPTKLQMIALGAAGGEASKALAENFMANKGVSDALRRLEMESGGIGISFKELNAQLKANLALEKQGKDDNNKQVNELSKANILFEARMKDVAAGMNEYLLKPLYNLNPALKEFSGYMSKLGSDAGGTGKNIRGAFEDAGKGKLGSDKLTGPESAFLALLNTSGPAINEASISFGKILAGAGQDFLKKGGELSQSFIKLGKVFADAVEIVRPLLKTATGLFMGVSVRQDEQGKPVRQDEQGKPVRQDEQGKPVAKRNTGSISVAGKLFEDWGSGTLVELHGLEGVIKPDEMMNMAKGMAGQGAAKAFDGLKGQLNQAKDFSQNGLDLSKISKDVTTTISPATKIEMKKEEPKIAGISKVEVINWPKDLGKVIEVPTKKEEPNTGKSREEQAEAMKKGQQDAAIEAKMRLIGLKEGLDAEAKARSEANALLSKEMFATGQIMSKEAAIQASLNSKQTEAKVTVDNKNIDSNSKEGQAVSKQMDAVKESIGNLLLGMTKDGRAKLAGPTEADLEGISKDLVDSLPAIDIGKISKDIALSISTDSPKDETKDLGSRSMSKIESVDPGQNVIKDYIDSSLKIKGINKDALNEMLGLNQQERAAKKQKYQEEYDLSQKEIQDRDKRLMEIEKRYEDEGRIDDAKNDEEYKKLEAEEKIFVEQRTNAIKNLDALKEVDRIKRNVEFIGFDFEKELSVKKLNLSKETAIQIEDDIAKANEIAEDIQEALPVDLVHQLSDNLMLEANTMAEDIKNALPFDEFEGLTEAIELQKNIEKNTSGIDIQAEDGSISQGIKINPETGQTYSTVMSESGDDSDAVLKSVLKDIKSALPFDEFEGLTEAIELQKNIEKNTSGIDIQAEDGSISQGIKINPETGQTYSTVMPTVSKKSLDEQVSTTNPFFNDKGEVNLNSINLPGMKKFGADLKSQTAAVAKKDENQSDAETARLQRQTEQKNNNSSTESKTDTNKATAATSKDATLNDVVMQLSSLNISIKDLIDQNGKLLGDQIRAIKSNNKNNFVGA